MTINMTARNARWPKEDDAIFAMAKRAADAIEKYGKENVINSTLGTLYEDDGRLATFDSVYSSLRSMKNEDIASYAQIAGGLDFQEEVVKACFGEYKPEAFIRAVATPGGTGAVRHAIWTYAGLGDDVICPDWYWKPYESMCDEFKRNFVTFKLFDDNFAFNIKSFEERVRETFDKKDRGLIIINSPANNPTGYSLSDDEWDKVLAILKDIAKNPDKRVNLLIDIAYIEYAGDGSQKAFFKKFSNLPENIFVFIAYSMSKAYTAYGMRSGAAIGISSNKEIAEEFYYSLSHANRCNWSNGNHSAMNILVELNTNEEKKKSYKKDLEKYKEILQERADAFVDAALEVNLEMVPYFGGFFISIPCDKPKELSEKLEENNLFAISNKNGLRFAVCAVSKEKCRKSPKIIKEIMESL